MAFEQHSSCFVPFLIMSINVSFSSGVFPESLKEAIISPIIKKLTLEKNTLSNYWPVSNIKVVAKIIEMTAADRLTDHLNRNNLTENYQSANKTFLYTETALLRVKKNDFISAIDKQQVVLLVMLDLSAALDTIRPFNFC
ncbi:hypothetical protein HOLleu_16776 [Holothuria leucospilota]|uniref:Uncharacterized protein n=1 Tax=Holothuria leucospilota TaxID=206669 RepID=A0A9Q1HBG2_HOLLE|nr:hypothetical protein HOLleu_16776 [Holothuria leucospilota]